MRLATPFFPNLPPIIGLPDFYLSGMRLATPIFPPNSRNLNEGMRNSGVASSSKGPPVRHKSFGYLDLLLVPR